MAAKRVESLGPTGDVVRQRLREIREQRGLSYAELSRRLADVGRPIPPLALRRAEEGERRIDVDDLVALAYVLGTSPMTLMLPAVVGLSVFMEHTALGNHPSELVRRWLGGEPLRDEMHLRYEDAADASRYLVKVADNMDELGTFALFTGVDISEGWPLTLQYNHIMGRAVSEMIRQGQRAQQVLEPGGRDRSDDAP